MATYFRVLACLVIFCSLGVSLQAEEAEGSVASAQVEQWVKQLDDDDFEVRETAMQALIDAGCVATPQVEQAAQGESLEAATRAFRILEKWLGKGPQVQVAARASLASLAKSVHDEAGVGRRAERILARSQADAGDDFSDDEDDFFVHHVVWPFPFLMFDGPLEPIVWAEIPGDAMPEPVVELEAVEEGVPDAIWADLALPFDVDVEEVPLKSSIELELPELDSE